MKRETEYAYAVARVRANENSLLTQADIDQMIAAPDFGSVMRHLADCGWGEFSGGTDYTEYLEKRADATWQLLSELLSDIHELDMLIIRNDMQNLKAALKSIIAKNKGEGPDEELFVVPTVYDTDLIRDAVAKREFTSLPQCMQIPAKEAYDILVSTGNGQMADAVLDKATLGIMLDLAYAEKSDTVIAIAERICATSDIKIAYRACKTGKDKAFLQRSLCGCKTINASKLCDCALEGTDALGSYIAGTMYSGAKDAMEESTSAFEKWCDDIIMECVRQAKFKAFGIDPIVAYFVARDSEIKSVRIILSAKLNSQPADIIRERMRMLYV
jgi:V/A-type H+-transporting ATPase subunit C